MIWRIALLTLLLVPVIALGASGAWARSEPLQEFANQPAIGVGGTALSEAQVRAAIIAGAQQRKWTVTDDAPSSIVARLVIRNKHTMVVDIRYTASGYSVTYRDSVNLNYNRALAGAFIHPAYNKEVRALVDAVRTELGVQRGSGQAGLARAPPTASAAVVATPRQAPLPPSLPRPAAAGGGTAVQMVRRGGTFMVPVRLNGVLTLDVTVDSGASDVTLPDDVVQTLMRAGTIGMADYIGEQTYVLADGTRMRSAQFRLRSVQVGDRVLTNVRASMAPRRGSLLLGQSFLSRFRTWSMDNTRGLLILE